jgi:hypothetical protein
VAAIHETIGSCGPPGATVARVRSGLERLEEDRIRRELADGWGIGPASLVYLPVGGGAYHWIAPTAEGRQWFVTCDDLDIKPWLGTDRDSVFDGLLEVPARQWFEEALDDLDHRWDG